METCSSIPAGTVSWTEEPRFTWRSTNREDNLILLSELPQPLFSTPGHFPHCGFSLFLAAYPSSLIHMTTVSELYFLK